MKPAAANPPARQPHGTSAIPWLLIEAGHEWIRELRIDWERATAQTAPVKQRERHSVVRIEHGGAAYYLKRYRMKRQRFLIYLLFGSKAWREWQALRRCVTVGIPVSAPLAFGHRAAQLESEWFLLLANLPGENLYERLAQLARAGEHDKIRRHLRQLGEFTRELHERGFFHSDLKVNHVIWNAPAGQLALLDLDGAYFPRIFFAERKAKNLLQIVKSLPRPLRKPDAGEPLLAGYQQAGSTPAVERSLQRKLKSWFARNE